MKLYECNNIPQVARKVAELTATKVDKATWRYYCNELKRNNRNTDTIDYISFIEGEEIDVAIMLQYDSQTKQYLVGVED